MMKSLYNHFYGVPEFDRQPHPGAWTLGPELMEWMLSDEWLVELYASENFDILSINVTEEWTNKWTNIRMEKRKLYTPRMPGV